VAVSVGQTIGDYRVIAIIGVGGMGTVYKVQHLLSERIEAMKVVLPSLAASGELADRFVREIKLQARLSHQNIALLHNVLRHEDQLLMVMEYVEGMTLNERLNQGVMQPGESMDIGIKVLRALAYAHQLGVVHRDIKPANIMVNLGESVKLMDFGIARSDRDTALTQTGIAVGSVYYMSPEQVRGGAIDGRSDIYSVGVVLYEMVTAKRPIDGDSSLAVMNAHVNQIPRPPITINQSVPPALSLAILKALEKDPAGRFQSATDFADTLQSLKNRLSSEPHAPVYEPPAPPPAEPAPTPPPAVRFEIDGLDRLTKELAVYVGPLARVLVKREVKKAQTWRQLYDALAEEVPPGDERKRFLAKRPLS
jgi:serine/threonine-protein kinase